QGLPVCLEDALDCLEKDNDYLTAGGVFPKELINNFIKTKRAECSQISQIPHPVEFEKYYNL
ncbi:MAG: glutamine synthetase, partial [Clostridia bacterium]|nr:glutamine synthetase [Clostridia bacterium]